MKNITLNGSDWKYFRRENDGSNFSNTTQPQYFFAGCWVGSNLNRFFKITRCLEYLSSGENRAATYMEHKIIRWRHGSNWIGYQRIARNFDCIAEKSLNHHKFTMREKYRRNHRKKMEKELQDLQMKSRYRGQKSKRR